MNSDHPMFVANPVKLCGTSSLIINGYIEN